MASYPYFAPLPNVKSRRLTGCGFYATVVGSARAVLDWFEEVDLVGFTSLAREELVGAGILWVVLVVVCFDFWGLLGGCEIQVGL
jgi:hypothetical protein